MALFVVTGPPAAGKTTWVHTHAKQGDIVIDFDRIAQALSPPGADTHTHGKVLRIIAGRARRAAIDEAIKYSQAVDVYIIHTQPTPEQEARYLAHAAQVVRVDPGREVVEQRCREQRSGSTLSAVARWYASNSDDGPQSQSASRAW